MKEEFVNVKNYISKSNLPSADFVINPYVGCPHKCMYCYAVFMKRFTNHIEEWGEFVDVKICEKPLCVKKLFGKNLVIGSVTDPYNICEKKYEITRNILEQIYSAPVSIDIITKSDLVIRDIDILSGMSNVKVAISLNSLDDSFRFDVEPYAPSVKRRINALKKLREAGIYTVLFMSPIFPDISDFKQIIDETKDFVCEYWFENLNLRAGYKQKVLEYIYKKYPDLKLLYQDIFVFQNNEYWLSLHEKIEEYCKEKMLNYSIFFHYGRVRG